MRYLDYINDEIKEYYMILCNNDYPYFIDKYINTGSVSTPLRSPWKSSQGRQSTQRMFVKISVISVCSAPSVANQFSSRPCDVIYPPPICYNFACTSTGADV